jgi:hypothetical protein
MTALHAALILLSLVTIIGIALVLLTCLRYRGETMMTLIDSSRIGSRCARMSLKLGIGIGVLFALLSEPLTGSQLFIFGLIQMYAWRRFTRKCEDAYMIPVIFVK